MLANVNITFGCLSVSFFLLRGDKEEDVSQVKILFVFGDFDEEEPAQQLWPSQAKFHKFNFFFMDLCFSSYLSMCVCVLLLRANVIFAGVFFFPLPIVHL